MAKFLNFEDVFNTGGVLRTFVTPFPRKIFVELMEIATTRVEFSFNEVMYKL